jgi:hypothetical protein
MSKHEQDQALERRAEKLRQVVNAPSEKERAAAELADVERQLAESRLSQGRERAKERLTGIRRAVGSVVASIEEDEKRIAEAKAAYEDALRRFNNRYGQFSGLKAEAEALCSRFDIAEPSLPTVMPPALRGIDLAPAVTLVGHQRTRPRVEQCEHGLRERRTYEEVRGSDGYAIIAETGLLPFPELTDRQQDTVARRVAVREKANREHDRMAQEISETKRALDSVPGMVGAI